MSDDSVIFSHSDLLDPHRHGVTWGLKQKLARTRGENLIHAVPPDLCLMTYLLEPLTEPSVSHNFIDFRVTLTSGFQWLFLEETLNL